MNIALGWQKIEEDVRLVLDNSLEKSHWGANSGPPDFLTVFLGRGKEGKRGDEREKGGKERARTKGEKEKFKGEKEEKRKRKRREGREEEEKRKREGKWRA